MTTVNTLNDIVDPNDGLTSLREALSADGDVVFDRALSGGTINLQSTLVVDRPSFIDAESDGGNITISGGDFDLIDMVGTSLYLSGLTLKGGSDAIEISGTGSLLSLNFVTIENSKDDGIDVRGPDSDITFRFSSIENVGDDGISLSNATNTVFFAEGGDVKNTGDEGIEVRNSNGSSFGLYDGFSITNAGADGIDIRSNDINLLMADGFIAGSGSDGLELRDSNNADIRLSNIALSGNDDGIDIRNSDNARISVSASINDVGDEGIEVKDSDQLTLELLRTTIDGVGGDGIDLKGGDSVSLSLDETVIQNNLDNGINTSVDKIDIVINGGLIADNGDANIMLKNTAKTAVSIFGTAGDDILNGSDVGDRIDGGAGNDILTGAERADVFGFSPNNGIDTITDFELGRDRLNVTALGITDLTNIVLAGNTVLFDVINGGQVDLLNVDALQLSAADFIFA